MGGTANGYRLDYRLTTDRRGDVLATVLRAETFDGRVWSAPALDPACAGALHAKTGELAEVRLFPLSPEAARLGDAFMASCAPRWLFFPMTDILNVTLIQASERFHIDDLRVVGQSASFDGFTTSFDRLGVSVHEASDAGQIKFAALVSGRATVDWLPSSSRLEMVQQDGAGPGNPLALKGTEHYAFRLEIDLASGALEQATTLYDDLDLVVARPGAPPDKLPRVAIRREVSITRIAAS